MENQLTGDRFVPWPWSLLNIPVSIKDLVGRPCRVIRPGEVIPHDYVPGRVSIYLDDQSMITDIRVEPEKLEL
jgi:hypothetical protein